MFTSKSQLNFNVFPIKSSIEVILYPKYAEVFVGISIFELVFPLVL